jgi:hypothetical protein
MILMRGWDRIWMSHHDWDQVASRVTSPSLVERIEKGLMFQRFDPVAVEVTPSEEATLVSLVQDAGGHVIDAGQARREGHLV